MQLYVHANEVIILKLEFDICEVIKLINYSRSSKWDTFYERNLIWILC